MLTFSEMKTQVAERISIDDSGYDSKIGNWINYRYDDIVGRWNWPQLYNTTTITLTGGSTSLSFPRDVDYIISIYDKTNDVVLDPLDPSRGPQEYISVLDSNGIPTVYWWDGISVLAQPSSASTITVESSSASDTTQYVRVWGKDSNGAEITEKILLTGTTAATSTNTYASIDRVSKDSNTAGLITGKASTTTLFKIDPYSYGSTNNRITIAQPSSSDLTLTYTYKRKVMRLINDEDTPIFDCCQALVLGAYVSALRQQRQHSKAKGLEYNQVEPYDPTTYEGKVRTLIQRYDQQAQNVPVFTPAIENFNIDKPYGCGYGS